MNSQSYYKDITNNDAIRKVYQTGSNLDAKYELERKYGIQKQPFEEWVIPQLTLIGSEKVLDVGCGQGRFLLPIARFCKGKGGHLIGCDIAEGVMHSARITSERERLPIDFVLADAVELPFLDGYFDLVMANHMLYHVSDIPKALHEISRVLKRGGQFLATTNSQNSMSELGNLHMQTMRVLGIPYPADREQSSFSIKNAVEQLGSVFDSVEPLIIDSGFCVTEPSPVLSYYIATQLYQVPFNNPDILQDRRTQIVSTFRQLTAEAICANGGTLTISKLVGAFICKKGS